MKKQTLFRSFILGSLLLSGSVFASVSQEEAIVGSWEYTRTFCEQGTQMSIAENTDGTMIITFDTTGAGEVHVSGPIIMLSEGEKDSLACTTKLGSSMNYSINEDTINFTSEAQPIVITFPDCPALQTLMKDVLTPKTEAVSSSSKFMISPDSNQLFIWNYTSAVCGENDIPVQKYQKL